MPVYAWIIIMILVSIVVSVGMNILISYLKFKAGATVEAYVRRIVREEIGEFEKEYNAKLQKLCQEDYDAHMGIHNRINGLYAHNEMIEYALEIKGFELKHKESVISLRPATEVVMIKPEGGFTDGKEN